MASQDDTDFEMDTGGYTGYEKTSRLLWRLQVNNFKPTPVQVKVNNGSHITYDMTWAASIAGDKVVGDNSKVNPGI
jgi:hypothetical protein